jgi:filamentous hemagglutinin family protein
MNRKAPATATSRPLSPTRGGVSPMRLFESAGRLLPVLGLLAISGQASAQLTGAQVAAGSASIQRNGANTVVHASNGAIINYQSFNVNSGESLRFIQPGATSRVLNRVTGPDPSRIAGTLTSNGIVYIVNPAGVYFAHGSLVNVGGIYASAGSISNADFLTGRNRFTGLTGTVENRGMIRASGQVHLLGQRVANFGTVVAPQGLVTMTAGDEVYLGEEGGQVYARVSGGSGNKGVQQAGTIQADHGRVILGAGDMYALAIEHTGSTRAADISLKGGATGAVTVGGTLDASNQKPGQKGGTVQVLGERVGILDGRIDASGARGGGTILVGGDTHGAGDVRTAERTVVSRGSTLDASATDAGDGGKVVVWSDNATSFRGALDVRGGAQGGDGGFAEVSGKEHLLFDGAALIHSRAGGRDGMLLLDPRDITIQAGAGPDDGELSDGEILFGDGGAMTDFVIGQAALEAITGDVLLEAQRDITLLAGVNLNFTNQTAGESITFRAGNDINIFGSVTTAGGSLTFSANDGSLVPASGTGRVVIAQTLTTNGGGITLSGAGITLGANLDAGSGSIQLSAPVVLTADLTLAGHDITFGSTIDSDTVEGGGGAPRTLTVNTTGDGRTRFDGSIGRIAPLATLTTNPDGHVSLNAEFVVADVVDFQDELRLARDASITGATGVLLREVNNDSLPRRLTIFSPETTLSGAIGTDAQGPLLELHTDAAGTTTFTGGALRAATTVIGDDLVIGAATTVTASTRARFEGRVDSDAGGARDLIVNSPLVFFIGRVGAAAADTALGLLSTGIGSTTRLLTPEIVAGAVFFSGPVVLVNDSQITASGAVAFADTLNSSAAGARDLTISSGHVTFSGAVGGTNALGGLTTDASAEVRIDADTVRAERIDFGGDVVIGRDTTITGSETLRVGGSVDSEADEANNLTLVGGVIRLEGSVGAGTGGAIGTLITQGPGRTHLSGTVTAGTLDFQHGVILDDAVTINGASSVRFGGTVDSDDSEFNDLTVNSPLTTFAGVVGGGVMGRLGTLRTDAAGTTRINTPAISARQLRFDDEVRLGVSSVLTASQLARFGRRLEGSSGGSANLTINSPQTVFVGDIGTTNRIGILATDGQGETIIGASSIRVGALNLLERVTLTRDLDVDAGGIVQFGGQVNSDANQHRGLTVTAQSTTFHANVGTATNGALGSLSINGSGTLAGTVTTQGEQVYNGPLSILADSVLNASGVTFAGTVNSASAADRALTINTTGNGFTRFQATVGALNPLRAITTNADGTTVLSGVSIFTSGAQTYENRVVLSGNATLSGSLVRFDDTVNSLGAPRSLTVNTSGSGTTVFRGAVGVGSPLASLTTDSDGLTRIEGGRVVTTGQQAYNDNVQITADTTLEGTSIFFGGALNSGNDARSLTVRPAASGTTTFAGTVGGTSALLNLLVGPQGGPTGTGLIRILGASIRTSGDQTYDQPVELGRDVLLRGINLTLSRGVDSAPLLGPFSLALNTESGGTTTLRGAIGGMTGLNNFTTNADGRTILAATTPGAADSAVRAMGTIGFGNAVEVQDHVMISGARGVAFDSTLNSQAGDSTGRDVVVTTDVSAPATPGSPSIPRITFGGDVGGSSALGSLTLGQDLSLNPAAATIGAGLNASNQPISNFSLTINTRRGFFMGQGQRFTVLGNLTINAGTEARLGDINTLRSLTVNAPQITLLTRAPGPVVAARGGGLVNIPDPALSFVAGNRIDFSTAPMLSGGFAPPSFGTPGGTGTSANLANFAQRDTGAISAGMLAQGANYLDLAAVGPTNVNLAESLATAVPPEFLGAEVGQEARISDEQVRELARVGVPTRPGEREELLAYLSGSALYVDVASPAGASDTAVAIGRLPASVVSRVLADYRAIFTREATDDSGQLRAESNAPHVAEILSRAWAQYAAAAGPRADAVGFRAYVEAVPTQAEALYYLNALRRLFTDIGYLGLTPGEARRARDAILAALPVTGMSKDQLEAAIVTQALGAPAQ